VSGPADPHRTVAATRVDDVSVPDVAPGAVEVLQLDGVVWGYGFACPGCGQRSFLALGAENPSPRWSVAAGDVRDPSTVTLSPSIFHTKERGGCGWHGWLRAGSFVPC